MDTPNTATPPSTDYSSNDAYGQYVRTGQLQQPRMAPAQVDPAMSGPAEPAASAEPSFPLRVKAAETANGGKPLDEKALDTLYGQAWAEEEPKVWASRKGMTKAAVASEKGAADAKYAQFKAGYLKSNPAASTTKSGIGDTLADAATSAAGTVETSGIEAGRILGGLATGATSGLRTLGAKLRGDTSYDPNTDPKNVTRQAYENWYDNTLGAKHRLAQDDAVMKAAAQRSPTASSIGDFGGVLASALLPGGWEEKAGQEGLTGLAYARQLLASRLPAALKLGAGQTAETVHQARAGGATQAEQDKLLATLPVNTALGLAGGSESGNVLRRLAVNAGVGAAGGGAAQEVEHALAPNQIEAPTFGDLAKQGGITALVGELGHRVGGLGKRATPAVDPTVDPNASTPPAADGTTPPSGPAAAPAAPAADPINAPPGAGLKPELHAKVLGDIKAEARDPIYQKNLPADPAGRAAEVVQRAQLIASEGNTPEHADAWAKMDTTQRQEAVDTAAEHLATVSKTQGVGDALTKMRQDAAATQAPPAAGPDDAAAPVGDEAPANDQPAPAEAAAAPAANPADNPTATEQAAAEEIPGMESTSTPEAAAINQSKTDIAKAAMAQAGDTPNPLTSVPKDVGDRTAEHAMQGGTVAEVQARAALDAQLKAVKKGLGKKMTAATLSKMTLAEKTKMLADSQPKAMKKGLSTKMTPEEVGKLGLYAKAEMLPVMQTEEVTPAAPAKKGLKKGKSAPSAEVQAATAKVDAPGINKLNDLGKPRKPGEPLSSKTPVVITNDVHLAGGVSQDGNTIYIDKRMPKFVTVEGKRINVHEAVALHERVEWPLMKEMGAVYHDAHDAATAAENHFIRSKYGVDPVKYQDALKAAIKKAGIENRHPDANIPANLDSQPNVDLGDTKPLEGKVKPGGKPLKKAAAPVEASLPEPTNSSDRAAPSNDPVTDILDGKVDPKEARSALERAQQGDRTDFDNMVRELRIDGDITADEARQLREASRTAPNDPSERAGIKAKDAPEDIAPTADELYDQQEAYRKAPPETEEAKAAADVDEAATKAKVGLKSDASVAKNLVEGLRERFKDSPNHQKAIDLLEFALKKNPALLRGIKGVYAENRGKGDFGVFNFTTRILKIATDSRLPVDTAVHELMHASEGVVPRPIQERIIAARRADITAAVKTAPPEQAKFFKALQDQLAGKNWQERQYYTKLANHELTKLGGKISREDFSKLYALTDASEYWATNAADLIAQRMGAKGVVGTTRQWLKEFGQKVSATLSGNTNKTAIMDGLNHVLGSKEDVSPHATYLKRLDELKEKYNGTPSYFSPVGNEEQVAHMISQSPEETVKEDNPWTHMDNTRELLANNLLGFDKADQDLRRLGILGKMQEGLYNAAVRLGGQRENLRSIDNSDVVEPLKAHFATDGVWQKYGKTDLEAVDKVGMFFQVHHMLTERLLSDWMEGGPLNNGREITRQKLVRDLNSLKLKPEDFETQLKALNDQHASMPFEDWVKSAKGPDFIDGLKRKQAELAHSGMTPESMATINKMLRAIDERQSQRLVQSGKVAADDPWRRARNWKWYVPEKGGALDGMTQSEAVNVSSNELTGITRPRRYVTNASQLKTAEGRSTWASNPVLRLIVDMGNSSGYAADHNFTEQLLTTASSARKALRKLAATTTDAAQKAKIIANEYHNVVIHTFEGTPRQGYTDVKTGQHYDSLPPLKNSVVHNDGRTHYIIEYPENSRTYRGLEAMNTAYDVRDYPMFKAAIEAVEAGVNALIPKKLGLQRQTHLITRSTQFIGKANTIINPIWTGMVLLPRTLMEKPLMLAIKNGDGVVDGMKLAASAYNEILRGTLGGGKEFGMLASHDLAGMHALGTANPESFAGYWKRMNDAGGGTAFTQGFTMDENKNALVQAIRSKNANVLVKGGKTYMKYAAGWADALENVSSVGIFKSLVKAGMSDAEAAAKTKDLLNFQQTGTAGKALNGFHAYFRVIASVNDTMYRAFQHTDGRGVDWGKVAKWSAVLGGYAAAKYAFDRGVMGNDENGVSNLKKAGSLDPYTLIQKSFIPTGNTDHPYALPVGLGFPQLLTAPGTLAAAVAYGDISLSDATTALRETLQRNISIVDPVGTSKTADTPTQLFSYALGALQPTAMAPATALYMNTNNFGTPIHTGYAKDDKFHADQGKRATPQVWKDLAQSLQEHTGIDFYPETLPFVAQNYGGSAINDIVRLAVGQGNRTDQGLPDNTASVISRLRVNNADYYDSERMYNVLSELNVTRQQVSAIKARNGDKGVEVSQQWIRDNPDAQARLTAYNQLNSAQKTYQQGIKDLAASKDGPDRKQYVRKALDSALRQATDKAQKALDYD
jgi:hypothetical protein